MERFEVTSGNYGFNIKDNKTDQNMAWIYDQHYSGTEERNKRYADICCAALNAMEEDDD